MNLECAIWNRAGRSPAPDGPGLLNLESVLCALRASQAETPSAQSNSVLSVLRLFTPATEATDTLQLKPGS
jgi:hypothetical protein